MYKLVRVPPFLTKLILQKYDTIWRKNKDQKYYNTLYLKKKKKKKSGKILSFITIRFYEKTSLEICSHFKSLQINFENTFFAQNIF